MPLSTVTLSRSIHSYARVQSFISRICRGKDLFVKKRRFDGKVLLNVGCGPYPLNGFINLDYFWNPAVDICWDITSRKYPIKDSSLEGIFTEHCLEHIPFEKCLDNLKEFHRLLKPNGTVRVVVPDGQIYIDLYQERKAGKPVVLPYGEEEMTPMISLNRIMRGHGHLFIYDFETMSLLLEKAGFKNIRKETFHNGRDPRLLVDRPERAIESLYVEASK